MKKILLIMFSLISLLSCSLSDEKIVATCNLGKTKYQLKLKEIKKDFLNYAISDPSIVEKDVSFYKSLIENRYLKPEILYYEQLQSGITNTQEFQQNLERVKRNVEDSTYIKKGQEIIQKEGKDATYEVARASHILLTVPRYTNIGDKTVELSESEYNTKLEETKVVAQNIIDSIKTSKNPLNEFKKVAVEKSQDRGSAANGGDTGYFTRGEMVKEFEDAVFTAKKTGIIENPVKTHFGFHIIYVTDLPQKRSLKELKSKVNKDMYKRIERNLVSKYQDFDIKDKIVENFQLDQANKKVIINGNSFDPKDIPEDSTILTSYKKPYSWKDSKEIISFYVPNFTNNLDFNSFLIQMGNLKRFLYIRDASKSKGYGNTAEFKKDYSDTLQKYITNIVVRTFESGLYEKAKTMVTEKEVKDFYEKNKNLFVKEEKGKKVTIPFKDAIPRIRSDLEYAKLRELENAWFDETLKKYKINFNENAIKTLIAMEKSYIEKFRKEQEKQLKKQKQQQKQKS